jgi:DNA polymerase I-like protein with 3'-5' exonuclease and polymerase domains
MQYSIVTSVLQFVGETVGWDLDVLVCDIETHPTCILGVSLAPLSKTNKVNAIYIPLKIYDKEKNIFLDGCDESLVTYLSNTLLKFKLIGHNFTFDKSHLDRHYNINTNWVADTRIMWHLASAPAGPRPYGLKDAQVELLGMEEKGNIALKQNIKANGGKGDGSDMHLADLEVLGKYAALDAYSTAQLYNKLAPFFDIHDYWWMLEQMMQYNILLQNNTDSGVLVDVEGLGKAHNRLLRTKEAAKKRFTKEVKNEIESLEKDWADRRIAEYKRESNRAWYANHPEKWERFNLNSDAHKRELFFEKLGHTPLNFTEGGKPSVDGDSIKRLQSNFVEAYLKYEKANTISTNFSGPYLSSVIGGIHGNRLHPGFNICGTVSYRLSGFKPYLLNAPFDEKAVLKNLTCDPGYVGVHADLSAIEPTVTAHYSEDPSLLKVFRDGLGDIYLDLALELFKTDKELHYGYNPNIPITSEVKERFAKQRKVAKVIQLAVQYTGTKHTVSKNLTKEGIPTTVEQADEYVKAYWRKFDAVRKFNYQLREVNRKDGHLRNIIGRIIRVPDPEYKDLPNRFVQSSAHDILILWVLSIYGRCKEEGIKIKPILLDCHDSTSNQVPKEQAERLRQIYASTLRTLNDQLGLCVKIKAEAKTFNTLAGLKNEEE